MACKGAHCGGWGALRPYLPTLNLCQPTITGLEPPNEPLSLLSLWMGSCQVQPRLYTLNAFVWLYIYIWRRRGPLATNDGWALFECLPIKSPGETKQKFRNGKINKKWLILFCLMIKKKTKTIKINSHFYIKSTFYLAIIKKNEESIKAKGENKHFSRRCTSAWKTSEGGGGRQNAFAGRGIKRDAVGLRWRFFPSLLYLFTFPTLYTRSSLYFLFFLCFFFYSYSSASSKVYFPVDDLSGGIVQSPQRYRGERGKWHHDSLPLITNLNANSRRNQTRIFFWYIICGIRGVLEIFILPTENDAV